MNTRHLTAPLDISVPPVQGSAHEERREFSQWLFLLNVSRIRTDPISLNFLLFLIMWKDKSQLKKKRRIKCTARTRFILKTVYIFIL